MFEKEAEEYNQKVPFNPLNVEKEIRRAFQKGAEFGYNKAKEKYATELKEVVETCNHWQEVAEKANKWHFVKDELPELYKDVLVVFPQGDCEVKYLTKHNEWVGRGSWCSLADVIAWKEIVLPKEIKEND